MLSHSPLLVQDLTHLPPLQENADVFSYLQSLNQTLPLFQHLQSDQLLEDLLPTVKRFQAFDDVVVLGTGGSSLGGQTLLALRHPRNNTPRIHFLDNIDPRTFKALLPTLSVSKTGVIAISKSGNTAETLMQLLVCLQHWQTTRVSLSLKDHFLVVSEPTDNGIRRLASPYALPCLEHPQDIGGRFAVFTLVGMLPAMVAGIDVKTLRDGARSYLSQALETPETSQPLHGALLHSALAKKGVSQTVLMPYADRLSMFTAWFRQLWAESLGKKGSQTITPLHALGTVDQHSQLQLYLDGPRDKLFTIIALNHDKAPAPITLPPVGHPAVDLFQGKTMGELMVAEQQATIDTLRRRQCPTRVIKVNAVNPQTLGALIVHYILETLATARLMGVNPFDQPAVEDGKILAQQYLAGTP